jgi:hypothetical protein
MLPGSRLGPKRKHGFAITVPIISRPARKFPLDEFRGWEVNGRLFGMCRWRMSGFMRLWFFRLRFPFYRHNVEEPLVDVDVFSYPMFVTY